jgi:DNA-binding LacI/PurR family transcriptional regulator
MTVRLKDVAAHAGVSIKSVSNVVHGYPHISPGLRARVQASLAELGYRPNASARSLRTGRTGTIGLAVPRLHDAYFAEIAHHVVTAADRRGWTVLVEETGEDPGREAAVLNGLRPSLIDGLIFSPLVLDQRALTQAVFGTPLVLLGEHLVGIDRPRVSIDNVAAARDAVRHLVETGHCRIAAVGAQPGATAGTAALRLSGYRAGLSEAGLRPQPRYQAAVRSYQRPDGADAARALLRRRPRPDALFCFNDLLALGALRALHDAGVRVPDDVAVVGVDDIAESAFAVPSLTTVAPDKAHIAEQAVALLGRCIDDPGGAEPPAVVVQHRLVPRESTRPARRVASS